MKAAVYNCAPVVRRRPNCSKRDGEHIRRNVAHVADSLIVSRVLWLRRVVRFRFTGGKRSGKIHQWREFDARFRNGSPVSARGAASCAQNVPTHNSACFEHSAMNFD